jgi:hypothetical protein
MRYLKITIFSVVCMMYTLVYSSEPKPDYYGSFAVAGGQIEELQRLTGKQQSSYAWNGTFTELPNIIVYCTDIYFITYGEYEDAYLVPVLKEGGQYKVNIDEKIPLEVAPIKGEENMHRLRPRAQLTIGTYVFSVVGCTDNSWDFRCYYPFNIKQSKTEEQKSRDIEVPLESAVYAGITLDYVLDSLSNLLIASQEELKKFTDAEKTRSNQALSFFNFVKVKRLRDEAARANQSRKWGEVINTYQKILALDPQDWGAFLMLANSYTNIGEPDKGLEYAVRALRKIRYNVLFAIIADAYGKKGDKDKSFSWLEKALKGGFTMSKKDFDETFPQYRNDPQYNALLQKYGIVSAKDTTVRDDSQ